MAKLYWRGPLKPITWLHCVICSVFETSFCLFKEWVAALSQMIGLSAREKWALLYTSCLKQLRHKLGSFPSWSVSNLSRAWNMALFSLFTAHCNAVRQKKAIVIVLIKLEISSNEFLLLNFLRKKRKASWVASPRDFCLQIIFFSWMQITEDKRIARTENRQSLLTGNSITCLRRGLCTRYSLRLPRLAISVALGNTHFRAPLLILRHYKLIAEHIEMVFLKLDHTPSKERDFKETRANSYLLLSRNKKETVGPQVLLSHTVGLLFAGVLR